MKKVLMIVYSFPPLNNPGVQRPVKFIKYLRLFGWEPVVLTPKKPLQWLEARDYEMVKDIPNDIKIYRTSSLEITKLHKYVYYKLKGNDFNDSLNRKENITQTEDNTSMQSLFKNYLFHFISRIYKFFIFVDPQLGWFPFAVLNGIKIIKKENIDIVYSTSTPYSSHVVALFLSKLLKIKWVADFRDPWTNNWIYNPPSRLHRKIDEILERVILKNADKILSVSQPIIDDFINNCRELSPRKFEIITNGFDSEDFENIQTPSRNKKFRIIYNGSLSNREKVSPEGFFKALSDIFTEKPGYRNDFEITFTGYFPASMKGQIKKNNLADIVKLAGFLEHRQSLKYLMQSSISLLLLTTKSKGSQGVYSGKIFEYIGARKPILAIATECAATKLIRENNLGIVAEPENLLEIKHAILRFYQKYKNGTLNLDVVDNNFINRFERKNLTKALARVFDGLIK